ncbi:MAG TPA: hypothetical protein VF407_06260 [Polyangiaceae bacterium]
MKTLSTSFGVLCLGLLACSKPSSDGTAPATSAPGSSSAAPTTSASAAPAATGSKLAGSYTASAGTFYVPDGGEWSGTKWRGDDAGDGLGDGTITLTITGNHVDGTIDGPLGPGVIDGAFFGDRITARVDPKSPSDGGWTGTLDATVKDGAGEGELRATSLVNAHLVRQAKVTIKKGS